MTGPKVGAKGNTKLFPVKDGERGENGKIGMEDGDMRGQRQRVNKTKSVLEVVKADDKFAEITFYIRGCAHLAIKRFDTKGPMEEEEITEDEDLKVVVSKNKKKKYEPHDFEKECNESRYISEAGWDGMNASAVRSAGLQAVKSLAQKNKETGTTGISYDRFKMGFHVIPDGFDAKDGTPLIRIWGAPPKVWVTNVRFGPFGKKVVDARSRPRWEVKMDANGNITDSWEMRIRIRVDTDLVPVNAMIELIERIGAEIGFGEGRPVTTNGDSVGLGYGLFYQFERAKITQLNAHDLFYVDSNPRRYMPEEW